MTSGCCIKGFSNYTWSRPKVIHLILIEREKGNVPLWPCWRWEEDCFSQMTQLCDFLKFEEQTPENWFICIVAHCFNKTQACSVHLQSLWNWRSCVVLSSSISCSSEVREQQGKETSESLASSARPACLWWQLVFIRSTWAGRELKQHLDAGTGQLVILAVR